VLALVDRYLARNIAVPLIGTLVLAAMLLVLEKMLRLFDFVITPADPSAWCGGCSQTCFPNISRWASRSADAGHSCSHSGSWR
jgi:hypothetical protein